MIDIPSSVRRKRAGFAAVLAVWILTATGCACGPCQPGQEGEDPPKPSTPEPQPTPSEVKKPGIETWQRAELRTRLVGADWEIEGDCTESDDGATCKATREGMVATARIARFETDKAARKAIKGLEGTESATRDGNALLVVSVDTGGAARALFDALMAGKDPSKIDLTAVTVRDLRGVLKRSGWKSAGSCEKENVPTSRTTICRASRAGLEAEVRYRNIPGAPHESGALRVGDGVATFDQADVSLKVLVTDDNAAETLISDLQD
jgi:hypothetical protein